MSLNNKVVSGQQIILGKGWLKKFYREGDFRLFLNLVFSLHIPAV